MTYFKPAINGQRLAQLSMAVRFGPCVTFPRLTTIGALRERAIVDRMRTKFGKGLARAKDGARAKFGGAIAPQLDKFIAQMLEPVQQHIDLRCDDTQKERTRVMGLLSVERIVVDAIQKQLLPALDRELAKAKQEEARIAAIKTQERLQRNPFYFP
jgi:paraquat-inducible protein B